MQAGGGDITLEAQLVRLRNSRLTATARGETGRGSDGGNITIDATFVVLAGSQVQANAFGGSGGNIRIEATQALLISAASVVDASSQRGLEGTIDLRAPVVALLRSSVTPLPQTFLQAAVLLRARCAERLQGSQVSSFVVTGRDGVPAEPGSVLPSPLFMAPQDPAETAGVGGQRGDPLASPGGRRRGAGNGSRQVTGGQAGGFAPAVRDLACIIWKGIPR